MILFMFLYFLCIYCCLVSKSCPTLCNPMTAACEASLSFTISQSLLKFTSIESVMPSNHLILCRPLLLPSVFPSIRVFSSELTLHIWCAKYWTFSLSISPSSEYSGLTSFRIDWFDLLKSSLASEFESISSLSLSLLYVCVCVCNISYL